MDALPLDLLARVFSYLNLETLLLASQVCRPWHALSRENFIWRDLAKQRWASPVLGSQPREYYIARVLNERRAVHLLRNMCLGPREAEQNELQLLHMGTDTEDYVRALAAARRPDMTVSFYAREVLPAFQSQNAMKAWQKLLAPGAQRHVEDGAAIIAASITGLRDMSYVFSELDAIATIIRQRMNADMSVLETMHLVRQVLFDELQFKGDAEHYYDAKNSLIPEALRRRMANPITLCSIFSAVARRVGVTIDLMGTPGHFMTRFRDKAGVEIWIDCFRGGALQTAAEIASQYTDNEARRLPAPLLVVWARMLNNLLGIVSSSPGHEAEELLCTEQLTYLQPTDEEVRLRYAFILLSLRRYERLKQHLDMWQRTSGQNPAVQSRLTSLYNALQEGLSEHVEVSRRSDDCNPAFHVGQVVRYNNRLWVVLRWSKHIMSVSYQLIGPIITKMAIPESSVQSLAPAAIQELPFPILGRYFLRFAADAPTPHYIPNEGLRRYFPDD